MAEANYGKKGKAHKYGKINMALSRGQMRLLLLPGKDRRDQHEKGKIK